MLCRGERIRTRAEVRVRRAYMGVSGFERGRDPSRCGVSHGDRITALQPVFVPTRAEPNNLCETSSMRRADLCIQFHPEVEPKAEGRDGEAGRSLRR